MPAPLFNYDEVCDDLATSWFRADVTRASPASSAEPLEVERSLQTTPQLPAPLPITSPPESHPEKPRDAAESSRVTPAFQKVASDEIQED